MSELMEYRIRNKRSDEWVSKYRGARVAESMINLKLEAAARIIKPNGKPLCVYLPGAMTEASNLTRDQFSAIRMTTTNRGYASGAERFKKEGQSRGDTPPIMSSILGSFDKVGSQPFCRLTAFTAQQVEKWADLLPYFERVAELFETNVPERYAAQMVAVQNANPDWVISGTPFTTITVNNTYPTGIHTDKGDLDEGFSTLGVMRKGVYEGGWLTFPQYGVAADMQDGDLILMDAHDWHGNLPLACPACGELLRKPEHACEGNDTRPERVSVVCYFRTDIVECGSLAEEQAKRLEYQEKRAAKNLGMTDDDVVVSAATLGIDATEKENA